MLLAAVPAEARGRYLLHAPGVVISDACLGVLPLAGFMGDATEHLSARTGPTVGGLLNATFGNAAELIIAIVALQAGLVELVKASITGSILGNLLLILGLWPHRRRVRTPGAAIQPDQRRDERHHAGCRRRRTGLPGALSRHPPRAGGRAARNSGCRRAWR